MLSKYVGIRTSSNSQQLHFKLIWRPIGWGQLEVTTLSLLQAWAINIFLSSNLFLATVGIMLSDF